MNQTSPTNDRTRRRVMTLLTMGVALLCIVQGKMMLDEFLQVDNGKLYATDDFAHYYCGARRVYNQEQVYCIPIRPGEVEILPTTNIRIPTNPPVLSLLTGPLGMLPQPVAWGVWTVFLSTAYILAILWMCRSLEISPRLRNQLLCVSVIWGPLLLSLRHSQVQPLLTLGIAGAFHFFRVGRVRTAGMLLGGVISVKLLPIALLVFFVGRREWRFLFWATSSFAIMVSVSQIYPGLAIMDFWNCGANVVSDWSSSTTFNQSVAALARNLIIAGLGIDAFTEATWKSIFGGLVMLSAGVAAMLLLWLGHSSRKASRRQFDLNFGMALFASVVMAPLAWSHYYVMTIVPWIIVFRHLPSDHTRQFAWLAFFCTPFFTVFAEYPLMELGLLRRSIASFMTFVPGLLTMVGYILLSRIAKQREQERAIRRKA